MRCYGPWDKGMFLISNKLTIGFKDCQLKTSDNCFSVNNPHLFWWSPTSCHFCFIKFQLFIWVCQHNLNNHLEVFNRLWDTYSIEFQLGYEFSEWLVINHLEEFDRLFWLLTLSYIHSYLGMRSKFIEVCCSTRMNTEVFVSRTSCSLRSLVFRSPV